MDIGKSIRIALAQKAMTKTALAKQMGIHLTGVCQFCSQKSVRTETLQKLSTVFGMKVSEFVALGED